MKEVVEKVDERVTKPKDASKFLPWVHIAISNLKSRLRDLYHGVKEEFLQYYLDEFCYKFNRRYEKETKLLCSLGHKILHSISKYNMISGSIEYDLFSQTTYSRK